MALQNFVDNNLPTIKAAWLNAVDLIQNVVTGSAGGIAVTGTISAAATNGSGILALSSSTGTNGVTETFTNTGGTYTIGVDNSVGDIFGSVYSFGLNIPTSRTFDVNVNNTQVMRVSSTGLAVTGAVGADGVLTIAQASAGASRINMTGGYDDKMGLTFSNNGSGSYNSMALVETQGATPTLSVMGVSGIAPNADLTTGYTELATFTYGIGLAVTGTTSTTTGMAVGGATAGAGGIAFPATAVAVADANTLDDYEEGAWTPVPTAISGAFTTVGTVSGTYTKVGRLVSLYYSIIITDKGTGSAGMLVSGLPFAASGYAVGSGYQTSNGTQNIVHVVSGTTTLQVFKYDGTDPVVNTQLMRGSVTYFA